MKTSVSLLKLFLLSFSFLTVSTNGQNIIRYKTAYAYDDLFPTYYQNSSEMPDRVIWIDSQLTSKNIKDHLILTTPHDNPMKWIRNVHTDEHIKGIRSIPVNTAEGATKSIGEIAELAVAYILSSVDLVMTGKAHNAFANIRPPGHHVENDGYTVGFCAYANVVIAAKYAREIYNIDRILIVDWDYHYGNSTEFFFSQDTGIFLAEFGSYDYYNENNSHIKTYNVNEGNNEDFSRILEGPLKQEMRNFKPELILISCGFDLKEKDALGNYHVTASGISKLTRTLMEIADEYCDGKVVSILEGGYHDEGSYPETWYGLAQCAEYHVSTLMTGKHITVPGFFKSVPVNRSFVKSPLNMPDNPAALFTITGRKAPWTYTTNSRQNIPSGRYITINPEKKHVITRIK